MPKECRLRRLIQPLLSSISYSPCSNMVAFQLYARPPLLPSRASSRAARRRCALCTRPKQPARELGLGWGAGERFSLFFLLYAVHSPHRGDVRCCVQLRCTRQTRTHQKERENSVLWNRGEGECAVAACRLPPSCGHLSFSVPGRGDGLQRVGSVAASLARSLSWPRQAHECVRGGPSC